MGPFSLRLQQREERLRERKNVAAVAERGVPGSVADRARSRIRDPDPHQII